MADELACRNCKFIISSHSSKCPICGSEDLTSKWSGYIIMLNVDKSELAKASNIKTNGVYAISIRD